LPTKAVEGKTLFKAWYGFKPFVSHLRAFGCTYFFHVLRDKRNKLDSRSQPWIFVGYSNLKKGYRIYNPFSKKMIISKYMKFDEEKIWKCNATDEEMHEQGVRNSNCKPLEIKLKMIQTMTIQCEEPGQSLKSIKDVI
ncbi:hypothetical protein J1N35_011263, partial [Gossypium stocksii]